MNDRTFNHIRNLIKSYIIEDGAGMGVAPTNNISSGAISGASGKEGDMPPVYLDFRKNKYKKLPDPYKALFRRGKNVQPKRKS
jgi:hypothetical protein